MDIGNMPQINYMFWLLQALAMIATGAVVPGFKVTNPLGAVLMVVALAFVNAHIWDAALFFELPDSLTHRTLTLLVTNGVIFWVLVKVLPWIEIKGCLPALLAPIVFTLFSIGIGYLAENVDWTKTWNLVVAYLQHLRSTLIDSRPPGERGSSLLNSVLS